MGLFSRKDTITAAGKATSEVISALDKLGQGHTGKKERDIIIRQMFLDFFLKFEGSAADQHPSIQIVRGLVRPILTLWFVFLFSYLLWMFTDVTADKMDVYMIALKLTFYACAIVLAFWFGDRSGLIQGLVESFTTWARHRPSNGKAK